MRLRPHCLVISLLVIVTLAAWNSISSIKGSRTARAWNLLNKQPRSSSHHDNKGDDDDNEEDTTTGSAFRFLSHNLYKKFRGGDRSDNKRNLAINKMTLGRNNFDLKPKWRVDRGNDQEDDIIPAHREKNKNFHDAGKRIIPSFASLDLKGQPIDNTTSHDKWIVVTTIASPTDDLKFLANITGWKVVVVGDTKTPKDWSYPNCIYLSPSKQLELGLSTPELLPYKHYARKNVGYLYAIAHGAEVIYETDDDNRPLDRLMSFKIGNTMGGLMYSGNSTTFNPYRHFGQPTLWPRGYPLSQIGMESRDVYKLFDHWPTPTIQQGVVNGDPDMDAIFRLTRKLTLKPIQVKFDPSAPPVILPPGVFSPFNSQNTIFLKKAFWALLIPTTTTFRMCDIWRGYWAQRLLWEIGGYLGFFPPNAYQQRNAHNYMADMEDEKEMYFNTDRLLMFLTSWTCPENLTFFQCVYKLTLDMSVEGFWNEGDVTITKHWLKDLVRIGYIEPQRLNFTWVREKIVHALNNPLNKIQKDKDRLLSQHTSDIERTKIMVTVQGTSVRFVASDQEQPNINLNRNNEISQLSRHGDMVAKFCAGLHSFVVPTHPMRSPLPGPFDDILLIIVFNWPFYVNARYSEITYRPLFPNIIYCGENATQFAIDTASFSGQGLSFIEAPRIQAGQFSPWCIVKAMQMNYNVKGFLVTGDDVLLNIWNFKPFDKTKIWMTVERYIFNVMDPAASNWMWWNTPIGNEAYKNAMASLEIISQLEHSHNPDHPVDIDSIKPAAQSNGNNPAPENSDKNGISKNASTVFSHARKEHIKALIPESLTIRPSTFLKILRTNMHGHKMAIHAISDIYYIPERLKADSIYYLTHFLAHNVFVELSVATVFYGLEKPTSIHAFHGTNLWMEQRTKPWAKFNTKDFFLHPVKLSVQDNLGPLCTAYFPHLLANGH